MEYGDDFDFSTLRYDLVHNDVRCRDELSRARDHTKTTHVFEARRLKSANAFPQVSDYLRCRLEVILGKPCKYLFKIIGGFLTNNDPHTPSNRRRSSNWESVSAR
jgi:hypothetical protein